MLSHRSLPAKPAHEFAAGRLSGNLRPWSIPPTVGHDTGHTFRRCPIAVPVVKRPCRQWAIGPWTVFRTGGRAWRPGRGTARSCRFAALSPDQARLAGEDRIPTVHPRRKPASHGTASAREPNLCCRPAPAVNGAKPDAEMGEIPNSRRCLLTCPGLEPID